MSEYNKATDRGDNGKIKRKFTRNNVKRLSSTPRWWRKTFMTRPKRCLNKRNCRAILNGRDYDVMIFPLGNKKPHLYYW